MKRLVVFLSLVAGSVTLLDAGGQSLESRLKQLFPAATSFSPKEGDPPHFTAYGGGPTSKTVIGYAAWTTEILPLERGYGGPIAMLIGLDTSGKLTGVIVGEHHEPYGDFSIDTPKFAATLRNNDDRDPFKLEEANDTDSRATVTMSSAVRAIRNSGRRMARELLTASPPSK